MTSEWWYPTQSGQKIDRSSKYSFIFWTYTLEDPYKLVFLYGLTTSLQDPINKPKVAANIK
jgi:hypothetical protein